MENIRGGGECRRGAMEDGERRGTEDGRMGSGVKEAEDSGEGERDAESSRAVGERRGGAGGGAPLGSPAPCFEDPACRTGAAQSCRDTAKPSGCQDAQKPGLILSTQTLLPSALPHEHLHVDGAKGR